MQRRDVCSGPEHLLRNVPTRDGAHSPVEEQRGLDRAVDQEGDGTHATWAPVAEGDGSLAVGRAHDIAGIVNRRRVGPRRKEARRWSRHRDDAAGVSELVQ